MIKNRTFMMGLGSGLVVGAILLQLMWIGQGSTASDTKDLTKEQLMAAAEALDMQVIEHSEELLTADQWEEKKLSEHSSETEGSDKANEIGTKQPDVPEQPESPEADGKEQKPKEVNKPAEPKTPVKADAPIKVNIRAGNNLSDVASHLLSAGVIDNKQAFINKATDRKSVV